MTEALIIQGLIFAVLLVVIGTFAWGAFRGAPWMPTKHGDAKRVIGLAQPKPGDRVVDLGCGSGEILTAFAVQGCRVEGWELAVLPWLVSRWRLRKYRDANIHFGDFWNVRIEADIVYVFLTPKTLERLVGKLRSDLRSGARVISYAFPILGLTPAAIDKVSGRPTVYRYEISRLAHTVLGGLVPRHRLARVVGLDVKQFTSRSCSASK